MQAVDPLKAVIVTVGTQHAALLRALQRLADQHVGLTLRHLDKDHVGPPNLLLPSAFRLAWLCVNEEDVGLPVVSLCYRRLSTIAPVTIASFGRCANGDEVLRACGALGGGVIVQPYTAETLPQVLDVITRFLAGP
jgi:hypothetical protein